MKKITIIIIALAAVLLTSCKVDNWTDWRTQNEMWLAANASKEGVQTSETGLQYKILYLGNTSDTKPDDASSVICSYTGKLINGYVFDSAAGATMSVSGVVDGFAEGIKKIHNHGDIELYVPYYLAYGDSIRGVEGSLSATVIPPYSTLIFNVHINSVLK